MTDDRLDRIEGQVYKLADAVIHMARMEERLVSVFKRMDNTEATVGLAVNTNIKVVPPLSKSKSPSIVNTPTILMSLSLTIVF